MTFSDAQAQRSARRRRMAPWMNLNEIKAVTHVTDVFVIGVTRARARAPNGDTERTRHMRHAPESGAPVAASLYGEFASA